MHIPIGLSVVFTPCTVVKDGRMQYPLAYPSSLPHVQWSKMAEWSTHWLIRRLYPMYCDQRPQNAVPLSLAVVFTPCPVIKDGRMQYHWLIFHTVLYLSYIQYVKDMFYRLKCEESPQAQHRTSWAGYGSMCTPDTFLGRFTGFLSPRETWPSYQLELYRILLTKHRYLPETYKCEFMSRFL